MAAIGFLVLLSGALFVTSIGRFALTEYNLSIANILSVPATSNNLAGASIAPQENRLKAPISGLVSMGSLPQVDRPVSAAGIMREPNIHQNRFSAVVVPIAWGRAEPTEGEVDFAYIDHLLEAVTMYNRRTEKKLVVKLRLFPARPLPKWIVDKGLSLTVLTRNGASEIGKFWNPLYAAAWRRFVSTLARRYDANPIIREVTVSSCASLSAEPLVIPHNEKAIDEMRRAGYTDGGARRCLSSALDDYRDWRLTPLLLPLNIYSSLDDNTGRLRPDVSFTARLAASFRSQIGQRLVLSNHGLTGRADERARKVYEIILRSSGAMGLQGCAGSRASISFQARSPGESWNSVVEQAVEMCASEIEIWNSMAAGGGAKYGEAELVRWARMLSR